MCTVASFVCHLDPCRSVPCMWSFCHSYSDRVQILQKGSCFYDLESAVESYLRWASADTTTVHIKIFTQRCRSIEKGASEMRCSRQRDINVSWQVHTDTHTQTIMATGGTSTTRVSRVSRSRVDSLLVIFLSLRVFTQFHLHVMCYKACVFGGD